MGRLVTTVMGGIIELGECRNIGETSWSGTTSECALKVCS